MAASRRSASMATTLQPALNDARTSSLLTRRGPSPPGARSLTHSRCSTPPGSVTAARLWTWAARLLLGLPDRGRRHVDPHGLDAARRDLEGVLPRAAARVEHRTGEGVLLA